LLPAFGIIAAGFPLYWLVPATPLRVVGLFLTGLGIANLYPLTLSLAIGTAAGVSATASARATLASATAIGVAPLVLGWLADHISIDRAHAVIPLLLVGALVANRLGHHAASNRGHTLAQLPIAPQ